MMVTRFVKMTFAAEKVNTFLSVFKNVKHKIKKFEGCCHLELLQDNTNKNIFFTYSVWETEKQLDVYRKSKLFAATWKKTKILFSGKPEAWTLTTPSPKGKK